MMRNVRHGFTMVELIVVIAIIGILSTLIVVSLDNAKESSRNARRLADVSQIQLALKMYYNDTGRFPTAITPNQSIAYGGTNYLLRVPANPFPRIDGGCPNSDYVYTPLEDGQRYSLSFCLGDDTDDLSAGPKVATTNGILNCDDGYIAIPGSDTFQTNDFCVMEYEAKCVLNSAPAAGLSSPLTGEGSYDNSSAACDTTRHVASVASGVPVASISQTDAKAYCAAIGAHLITNAEWMTIARNAEQVAANWDGGQVGNGGIYGNFEEAIGDDISINSNKHSLILSTGERIWRFGNSVAEWTDDTCIGGNGQGKYYDDSGQTEWSDGQFDDYERAASGPTDDSWDASDNIGGYAGCGSDGNGFVRGAETTLNNYNGLYNLDLTNGPSSEEPEIGFRCVK